MSDNFVPLLIKFLRHFVNVSLEKRSLYGIVPTKYFFFRLQQCGQHTKEIDYGGWPAPRNHMSMKQGYEVIDNPFFFSNYSLQFHSFTPLKFYVWITKMSIAPEDLDFLSCDILY